MRRQILENRGLASTILTLLMPVLGTLVSGIGLASEPLKANPPLVLSGKAAHFDFMEVDASNNRLLAAHAGGGSLAFVDLKTDTLFPELSVGNVQGVAVDSKSGTYILGDAKEHKVVFVSSKSLKKVGEISVTGPVDAIAFDSKNGMAYADEDDGSHVWVIDVRKQKLVTTILISGVPEFVAYAPSTDRLYQNIKTKDKVAVINAATNHVEAEWPTAPATEPHGLAIDSQTGHVFVAGHNGKLVSLDVKSGKVIGHTDIATGTDQITFDAGTKTIYCASREAISVVKETDSGLEFQGNVTSHKGAHTIAVDSNRHRVWISYSDSDHSYLQSFDTQTEGL